MNYKKESKIESMLNPRGKFLAYGKGLQLILHKKDMWVYHQFKKNLDKTNLTINYNGISDVYGAYHLFKCHGLFFAKMHPFAKKINMDTSEFMEKSLANWEPDTDDINLLVNEIQKNQNKLTNDMLRSILIKPNSTY